MVLFLPAWSRLLAFNEHLILRGVVLVSWQGTWGVGGREPLLWNNNSAPSHQEKQLGEPEDIRTEGRQVKSYRLAQRSGL